jgi:magnesium transporter
VADPSESAPLEKLRLLGVADRDGARDFCAAGEFCWMDLEDPDDETVEIVGEALGLDPLAIEDTQEFDQRPKLDTHHEQLLLVYYGAASGPDGTVDPVEVHVHVSGRFVLTVHRESCPALVRLHTAAADDPPDSQATLVYRVLDTLTDSLMDVLDDVVARGAQQEETVLRHPRAGDREQVARVRRSLDTSRRVLLTQRQVFDRMIERTEDLPALSPDLRANYADISDHLWRAVDDMETARASLQGMLDQYSSAVQERLTLVATIFLPLTVVTGFFGQNFTWMIDHIGSAATFWGLGVGGLAGSVLAIWVWLIRTGMYAGPGKRHRRG